MLIKQDEVFDYVVTDVEEFEDSPYKLAKGYAIARRKKASWILGETMYVANSDIRNKVKQALKINSDSIFDSTYASKCFPIVGILDKDNQMILKDDCSLGADYFKFKKGVKIEKIFNNEFLITDLNKDRSENQSHYRILDNRLYCVNKNMTDFKISKVPNILINDDYIYHVESGNFYKHRFDKIDGFEKTTNEDSEEIYYSYATKILEYKAQGGGRGYQFAYLSLIINEFGEIISPIYNSYNNEFINDFEDVYDNFDKLCDDILNKIDEIENTKYHYDQKLLEYVKKKKYGKSDSSN